MGYYLKFWVQAKTKRLVNSLSCYLCYKVKESMVLCDGDSSVITWESK